MTHLVSVHFVSSLKTLKVHTYMHLNFDDLCDFPCDGHGACSADGGKVLLGVVGTVFSLLDQLLGLAVFVHCQVGNILLQSK